MTMFLNTLKENQKQLLEYIGILYNINLYNWKESVLCIDVTKISESIASICLGFHLGTLHGCSFH